MKFFSCFIFSLIFAIQGYAQPDINQWVWMQGDSLSINLELFGNYGTPGVAAVTNLPAARQGSIRWTDQQGQCWLFGGNGFDGSGNTGLRNDLWKYDPVSKRWTWMSGSNRINVSGVYGTRGVAASGNFPGSREEAVSWIDASGNLWLMGGRGYGTGLQAGLLNDLWKYDVAVGNWTWVSGSNTINASGIYGTQQTPSPTNVPGARWYSTAWTDLSGNFWLMGGVNTCCRLNDLWKFDVTTGNWTWMHGSSGGNPSGNYGTKGVSSVSSVPGGRYASSGWVDAAGRLWLMGGFGYSTSTQQGYLNDLWSYNTSNNQWTWVSGTNTLNANGVYGQKGVASVSNIPGGRISSSAWMDQLGSFWIYGGVDNSGSFNDLWNYNPNTGNWTWVNGASVRNQPGVYPIKGGGSASALPGARYDLISWRQPQGHVLLWGGNAIDSVSNQGVLNDLWVYQPTSNQWQFLAGSAFLQRSYGRYGNKGISDNDVFPGAREGGLLVQTTDGGVWLMGGKGFSKKGQLGFLNDLWKYDPVSKQWVWLTGTDTVNQNGVYGTRGVSNPNNSPRARSNGSIWTDPSGSVWLFGGNSSAGLLNDFWRFQPATNSWTWMGGSSNVNALGVYGQKGIAAASNIPGSRMAASFWKDKSGNLWMMGGYGRAVNGQYGYLNDLWKFDLALGQWSWMGGSSSLNQSGFYGEKGIVGSGLPGSRQGSVSVTDSSGFFWLFGGYGYDELGSLGQLNDLWRLDPLSGNWTWMNGSSTINREGIYGVQRISDAANVPGARQFATGWADRTGGLWLYGGKGYGSVGGTIGYLSDLWSYNPQKSQWQWVAGSNSINPKSSYNEKQIAGPNRLPAPREASIQWLDGAGDLWMMGGSGLYQETNTFLTYNDLWVYKLPCTVQANFTLSKTTFCLNENRFQPLNSTVSNIATPLYTWSLGDGRVSSDFQPQISYSNPGTYTVKLVVDAGFCKDSISRTVEVAPLPDPGIQLDGAPEFCENGSLLLKAKNQSAGLGYQWKKDGRIIDQANESQLEIRAPGSYALEVMDKTTQCKASSDELLVTVKPRPVAPTGNSLQTFCNSGTVAQLNAEGLGLQWYNSLNATAPLPSNTVLIHQTSYFATQTTGGCESADRLEILVDIQKPEIPSGSSIQKFCYNGTVSGLTATGTDVQWYAGAEGGMPLPIDEALTDGSVYYASQTIEGCESANRLPVTVSLLNPLAPSGNSSQTFCGTTQLKALVVNGNGIRWYSQQTEGILLAEETLLNNGQTYYAAQVQEGCESRERLSVNVEIKPIPNAPTGSSSQQVCSGATLQSLTLTGSALNWYSVMENGSVFPVTSLITNGATYYASQTVNGCESKERFPVTASFIASISRPAITVKGLDLVSSATSGNQWYLNGSLIPGAAASTYRPVETGTYTVQITPNACGALVSDPVLFSVTGGEFVRIGPNPATQTVRVFWMLEKDVNLHLRIISEQGQLLRNYGLLASGGALDVAALQPGRYYVQLVSGDGKRSYVLGFVRGK